MDILAAQLHWKVKEASIDECKKALQKMSMTQAVQYLKKQHSSKRKENIDYLKDIFPEKSNDSIIKVLDESNDDLDKAIELLYQNPESLEENINSGIVPESKKVHMKKRSSSNKLTKFDKLNEDHSDNKLTNLDKLNDDHSDNKLTNLDTKNPSDGNKKKLLLSSVSLKNKKKTNNQAPPAPEKPKSWIISHDPIVIRKPSQKIPESSILPRMEIPPNKIESEWNKTPSTFLSKLSSIFTSQKKTPQVKPMNNPIYVNDQGDSDYDYGYDENDQYYDYDYEEEEEQADYQYSNQQGEEYLKTETIDLHGMLKQEAKFLVESSLSHAKKKGIGVFRFNTGKGNHSINNIPVLRPLVLEICKKFNMYAYIPERNTGYVVCNVNRPFA